MQQVRGEVADHSGELLRGYAPGCTTANIRRFGVSGGPFAGVTAGATRSSSTVPECIERVYVDEIGLLYAFSLVSSLQIFAADVGANCPRVHPESLRGDLSGHPPGTSGVL